MALATHGALELCSRADAVGAQADLAESVIYSNVFIHAMARLGWGPSPYPSLRERNGCVEAKAEV